ncbi:MAG: hypothetical protein ACKOAU_01250, partial [Pirellula sp.]
RGTATLTALAAANNSGIADLVADLREALMSGVYTILESDNPRYLVSEPFTEIADDPTTAILDPDLKISLRNGKLVLSSPYALRLNQGTSEDASGLFQALGFDTTDGAISGEPFYAIDASKPGSVVSVGSPLGPNGKLRIEGKVYAYDAILLYSGVSPDGTDIELGPTGVLETIDGSIGFNAGVYGDIRGDIIANGVGSDIYLNSKQSMRIRGNLTANHDIVIESGQVAEPNQISVQIDGTSRFKSTGGGGKILITGKNDVFVNGVMGAGSNGLSRLEIQATDGKLTLAKESGQIQAVAPVVLKGNRVDIQGVVHSTYAGQSASDYALTIEATQTATVQADVRVEGSVLIHAGIAEIYNSTIESRQSGRKLRFSGTDVIFSKSSSTDSGVPVQLGAVVTAPDLIEFDVGGYIEIGAGSVIATSAANSRIDLRSKSLNITGALLAGTRADAMPAEYLGTSADILIHVIDTFSMGGLAAIGGSQQTVGGSLMATGTIDIQVTGGTSDVSFSMNNKSAVSTVSAIGESLNALHRIIIRADQDIRLLGVIDALQVGADITVASNELLLVDGLIKAADELVLEGGSDETGFGLIVHAFEFAVDSEGNPLLEDGSLVRLHGGTVTSSEGGKLRLSAVQQQALSGVIGQTRIVNSKTTAEVQTISVAGGPVLVDGNINAIERIDFDTSSIMVGANGSIHTRGTGGVIDLRTSGALVIGSSLPGQEPGLIQGGSLVHLLGHTLNLDGQILNTESSGKIVINAIATANLYGSITTKDALRVHSGVDPHWSDSRLFGSLNATELLGGNILIDGAVLTSEGGSEIIAGGSVEVLGASSVVGSTSRKRPVIVTSQRTVDVVTGTRQIATGTVMVPVVSFTQTTITEQVGTESVRVGSEFNTSDVTLTQLGYYNASTKTVREKFMLGESQVGYMPLYNVTFANLVTRRIINGIPTQSAWHPAWENNYTLRTVDTSFEYTSGSSQPTITYKDYANSTIWNIPVEGWSDKYVYLPPGAEKDILRTVSQGTPLVFNEDVGNTYDSARVLYTQDKSELLASTADLFRYTDYDNSPSRWAVSYLDNGLQWYELTDSRTLNTAFVPAWNSGVPQVGTDLNNTSINAPLGYLDASRIVNQKQFHSSRSVNSGLREDKHAAKVVIRTRGTYGNNDEYFFGHINGDWNFDIIDGRFDRNTAPGMYYSVSDVRNYGYSGDGYRSFARTLAEGISNDPNQPIAWNYSTVRYSFCLTEKDWWPDPNDFIGCRAREAQLRDIPALDRLEVRNSASGGVDFATDIEWRWYGTQYYETYNNYTYNWNSKYKDIADQRLQLSYQYVTSPVDIYGMRPKFATNVVDVKSVQEQSVTRWGTVDIIQSQTYLVTNREFETGPALPQAGFAGPSINSGGPIAIAAGQDVAIRGVVKATGFDSTITITSGRDSTVEGIVPESAPIGTLPAPAQLLADGLVKIAADRDVILGKASRVIVDEDNVPETQSEVSVTAGRDASLLGEVSSLDKVFVSVAGDIALKGSITATNLIDVASGTDGVGSITGDIDTQLKTFGSQIALTAGQTSGDIQLLDSSLVSSPVSGQITLEALGGSVSQIGIRAIANQMTVRAARGIVTRTAVSLLDANNSGNGSIDLGNIGDATLVGQLSTLSGDITVSNIGALSIGSISTTGDIRVVTTDTLTVVPNALFTGDELTVDAPLSGMAIRSNVRGINLSTRGPGDVIVNNIGAGSLMLNIEVANGERIAIPLRGASTVNSSPVNRALGTTVNVSVVTTRM